MRYYPYVNLLISLLGKMVDNIPGLAHINSLSLQNMTYQLTWVIFYQFLFNSLLKFINFYPD